MTLRTAEFRVTARRRGLLVLATALVCIGCTAPAAEQSQVPSETVAVTLSAHPSASSSPTVAPPTPPASPEPTGTPAASVGFEAPEGMLPPGSRVTVVVDRLQLRGEPGLDGPAVATASKGAEYFAIMPGPMEIDGISWNRLLAPEGGFSAWAAGGSGADTYLALVPPDCPSADPDLATLIAMLEWDRLSCFGDRHLTVEGTYGCPIGCGGTTAGDFEPMWLAFPSSSYLLGLEFPTSPGYLEMRVSRDSELEIPAEGSIVRVTGHFSDPAATTCRITTGDPLAVDPTTAEVYCRERFVVDAFAVIGTDPDAP